MSSCHLILSLRNLLSACGACLLFCSSVSAAPVQDVGDVAAASLQQAVTSGTMLTALDVWYGSAHYRLNRNPSVYEKSRRVTLQREASGLGALLSYEVLSVDQPIEESAIVYAVVKYESGAVFVKLIYYLQVGGWDLKRYKTCMNPTHILPDSLYAPTSEASCSPSTSDAL
ncbi:MULTISPECIES: hypothetical protein [unclassified Lentimonas]|uniref:hypothetical protein n=1 Tax=unclassified Lentimonas TaxID=2630993 RepID=UPI00132C2E52|nr:MULTISPECIES: hypothetical protein [unclassified Lentimonas]CAA6687000.1 Unannotated [Lentimonas sp. CC6]CAA7172031.1 Unannotated [Lentimonas sp. CC21]CAA6678026.1 Unannotated [Lentimonas sp. CC4]CAA7075843.1 Unannotated [Lentimonas sp. CC4]CAA7182906.1 Unannotated [Lentimonas sp. CC8]